MSNKYEEIIKLIDIFTLDIIKENNKDPLTRKIMCDDKDLESFDIMYKNMIKYLIYGAEQDLLPCGFVEDFIMRLRVLKIKYDEKIKQAVDGLCFISKNFGTDCSLLSYGGYQAYIKTLIEKLDKR